MLTQSLISANMFCNSTTYFNPEGSSLKSSSTLYII